MLQLPPFAPYNNVSSDLNTAPVFIMNQKVFLNQQGSPVLTRQILLVLDFPLISQKGTFTWVGSLKEPNLLLMTVQGLRSYVHWDTYN